ncbi:helix-turn-helix domain-containing protein [Bacillus safensis]|uniref:helix-turn-helix domain-containing protein n=1 Tax=Bacillus safensis TaxID=561879 RepID=UPI002075AC3B|nr:helix-turn-helix domain-containing protein [Bacillus safensis]USD83036.1 helix-turn-helix domain-containing protein [Bacillus safensis]
MEFIKGSKTPKTEKGSMMINHTPIYRNIDVKNIRKKMNMTQKQFSKTLGVSVKTIEAWENGRNKPNGVAMRLLEICKKKPELFVELKIINEI